jgi:hypothetical protein
MNMKLLNYLTNAGKVYRAQRTLETLGTQVRGPFLTPQRNSIYVVDECILTESELVGLYRAGHRNPQIVAKTLSELRRLQTC